MMVLRLLNLCGLVWKGIFLFVVTVSAQERVFHKDLSDEKELKVKIDFGSGKLRIKKAADDALYRLTAVETNDNIEPKVRYEKSGTAGALTVSIEQSKSVNIFNVGDQNWTLELTRQIPILLKADIGACNGDMDFTDLRIKDIYLSGGASTITLRFEKPNRERLRSLKIDAGISRLYLYGLGHANIESMKFQGGVGSYRLDFTGTQFDNNRVDISVGVGKAVLLIPEDAVTRIITQDNFLSSVNIDADYFESLANGMYLSKKRRDHNPDLTINIEAGLGKIDVIVIP